MTREEEIQRKAGDLADFGISHGQPNQQQYYEGFIDGAKWADEHPREGLWDAEKVTEWLENHAGHYITLENDEEGELQSVFYQKGLIDDLRKAMETEL